MKGDNLRHIVDTILNEGKIVLPSNINWTIISKHVLRCMDNIEKDDAGWMTERETALAICKFLKKRFNVD